MAGQTQLLSYTERRCLSSGSRPTKEFQKIPTQMAYQSNLISKFPRHGINGHNVPWGESNLPLLPQWLAPDWYRAATAPHLRRCQQVGSEITCVAHTYRPESDCFGRGYVGSLQHRWGGLRGFVHSSGMGDVHRTGSTGSCRGPTKQTDLTGIDPRAHTTI